MYQLLHTLPWYISCFIFVIFCVFLSLTGLYFFRKLMPGKEMHKTHDVTSIMFNVVGVLYAVLLAYNILNVQDSFQDMHRNNELEANAIVGLYRDSQIFKNPLLEEIHTLTTDYTKSIINDEWNLMAFGMDSIKTAQLLRKLWGIFYTIDPKTEKDKLWLANAISRLNELNNYRFIRLYSSRETLGPMMWSLLLLGAIILVLFSYFFWVDNFRYHLIMTALLAGIIAFTLFLTFALDNPFFGDQSLQPDPFKKALTTFEHWEMIFKG